MPAPEKSSETVELVKHEIAFQGYFRLGRYFFRHSLHKGGMSTVISREVFERGQAGAVLPYDARRDEVVLIRQFRAGAYVAGHYPWMWEAVAGIIEENETAADMVRREAVEEANLAIEDLLPIHRLMLSPGASSESCQVFLGRVDTSKAGGVFGVAAEGEDILVKAMPAAEAIGMMERDEIGNVVAVVALQWLALHHQEMRKRRG